MDEEDRSLRDKASEEPGAIVDNGPAKEQAGVGGQSDEDKSGEEPPLASERVFEISPDLNISLAKDEPVPEKPPVPAQGIEKPSVTATGTVLPSSLSSFGAMRDIDAPTHSEAGNAKPMSPAKAGASMPGTAAKMPQTEPIVPLPKPPTVPEKPSGGPAALPSTGTPRPTYATSIGSTPPVNDNPIGLKLKRLRTYESDVAEVLAHRGASTASIKIAESVKKGEGERITNLEGSSEEMRGPGSAWKFLAVLGSVVIAMAGLGGGYYLYSMSSVATSKPVAPVSQAPKSLVPSDSQAVIDIGGQNASAILSKIKAEATKPLSPGSIKEIILAEASDNGLERAGIQGLIGTFGIPAPDILTRTLGQGWMIGIYADDNGGNHAFVAVTTNLFQNAFAGMLQWENHMADDLQAYLPAATAMPTAAQNTASTTTGTNASSSVTASQPVVPVINSLSSSGHFKDEIVKNKDVRAFVDQTGRTVFVYSFVDNSTLVFAEDDATLSEVISRLERQAFVR